MVITSAPRAKPTCLFDYLNTGREILPFDTPNAAYDFANALREKLNVDDKIKCMVLAEGHRVILTRRATKEDK